MIKALVQLKGQSITTVIQQHLGVWAEEDTKRLAEEHKKELDKAIEESRTRVEKPTGERLKDNIQVEKVADTNSTGYGVGNIDTLNQEAKWWYWINYGKAQSGRSIPPGTKDNPKIMGHFVPGQKGIFTKGQPKFPMNPKKAIKPHNYIEKALAVMISRISSILKTRII